MRSLRTALLVSLALPGFLTAQGVTIAPHAIFMDHRTRSGFVELYNPGTQPVEVQISTLFGYPITDSAGALDLYTPAMVGATEPSATDWIQAFPKKVMVPPLSKQTVRLLARPPQGLADGEYWTRIVVSVKAGALPVTGADTSKGIRVGLNLEVRTIVPVYYRKGAANTSVGLTNLRTRLEGDSIVLRTRLVRAGNAAYVGTVKGTLLDAANKVVGSFAAPVAVYYAIDPRFALGRGRLPKGRYRLRVEVATERPDIAADLLLKSPLVRDSVAVVIR